MTLHKICDDMREAIMASVMGEVDAAGGDEVRRHLDACDVCRRLHDALVEEERMLRSAFDAATAETGAIRDRLAERLSNQTPSAPEQRDSIHWRLLGGYRAMKPFYKLLSVAASVAVVIAVIWGLHAGGSRSIVFAEVVAPLRHIESLVFDVSMQQHMPGQVVTQTLRIFVSNDRMRVEGRLEGTQPSIVTINRGDDRYVLNPSTRRYKQEKLEQGKIGGGLPSRGEYLDLLSALPDATVKQDYGEQMREGRRVRGFEATLPPGLAGTGGPAFRNTVWVDVETRTLSGITANSEQQVDGHPMVELELKNMRWNETWDESLFQVPADCKPYVPPTLPEDGEALGVRHLQPGVKLTFRGMASGTPEIVDRDAVEWVALRNSGNDVALVVKLKTPTYKHVSMSAPWEVNFNDVLRTTPLVEQLTVDRKHQLVLFDVTPVATHLQEWLTPVESSHVLETASASKPLPTDRSSSSRIGQK